MKKNVKKVLLNKNTSHATEFLYDIPLPKTNKKNLALNIQSLKKGDKKNLLFLYSEYFNRAYRNNDYKKIFHKNNIYAIDGKGVSWANYTIKSNFYKKLYTSKLIEKIYSKPKHNRFLKQILIIIYLIKNIFSGLIFFILKTNAFGRTHNQVILGRDFKDEIINIAIKKQWRTLIIGSFQESVKKKIERVYPMLDFSIWSMPSSSKFMRDQSSIETEENIKGFKKIIHRHKLLNSKNLIDHYPQFDNLENLLEVESFDLILFSCGGMSGKQEFAMDKIQKNEKIDYTLSVGLGAAFDHLGAGINQKKTPQWISDFGMEWFYRILTNPSRAVRIIDSIFYFWYLVSIYPFEKKYHQGESETNPID